MTDEDGNTQVDRRSRTRGLYEAGNRDNPHTVTRSNKKGEAFDGIE